MNQFRADLHIHSRYSRATSRKLTPANLAAWAGVKGLHVLGTGDFTHAGWRNELKEALEFDEATGLYKIRNKAAVDAELPEYSLQGDNTGALFMLQGEISLIYKRGGVVRKVHNLVFMPTLEAAGKFSRKLAEAGNLESDGRPILGLDSKDLLEMVLEADPMAFLVPAHIWTPWFSLFGSKSGFNDITECFGDLSSEIFALETGLSSDPEMNRMWSALDKFRLVSNSDAHSGENLGREANLFSGPVSYEGIFKALKGLPTDTVFNGTLEFYPEEGKYHLDGHRKCGVALSPEETRELGGICPVCHKPLTIGVLYRVMELADRDEPVYNDGTAFSSLIPLPELLSEILSCGAKSKKVAAMHAKVVARFGSELAVLQDVPVDELSRFMPPLGEAVSRMRSGTVIRNGGYDGEYGTVRVFSPAECREFSKGALLSGYTPSATVGLTLDGRETQKPVRTRKKKIAEMPEPPSGNDAGTAETPSPAPDSREATNPDEAAGAGAYLPLRENRSQKKAVAAGPGPVLVIAGPGTGKTRTLVERAASLMDKGVSARHILAVTFTRRAAGEMEERLAAQMAVKYGKELAVPRSDTLHALAFELWHKTHDEAPTLLSEEAARRVFAETNGDVSKAKRREAWAAISLAREKREPLSDELALMFARYARQKGGWNLADYTDLLEFWLEQIQTGIFTTPWTEILVDEIQDLSTLQLELLRAILPKDGKGFFGIGDPDQSIYAFRGAHGDMQGFLREAWPSLEVVTLRENYRSAPAILRAASSLMREKGVCGELVSALFEPGAGEAAGGGTKPVTEPDGGDGPRIHLFKAPGAESEAAWIATQVRALIGGSSLTLREQAREAGLALPESGTYSPSDIAILVRMRAFAPVLQKALTRVGLLASVPEEEAFWMDERVARIIREAGRMIGIADGIEEDRLPCSDAVLARGPAGIAAYFDNLDFFDAMFWQSGAFKALDRAYNAYGGWQGLINWVNLQTELELVKNKSERVQILSLHAAKGLEFKAVFLPALEDGILPFAGPGILTGQLDKNAPPPDIDEERRLLYVGITRARECLFLSLAAQRRLFGRELRLAPSRFLNELPLQDLSKSALIAKQKREEKQLKLL